MRIPLLLTLAVLAGAARAQDGLVQARPAFSLAEGRYGELATRLAAVDGAEALARVRYVVHTPIGTPRGLVVLLPEGGGLAGDPRTGRVRSTPSDFLFENARTFADHGFLAIVLDRATTEDGLDDAAYDRFRLSPAHAQDIATVVAVENRDNLDVFLVGAGRGCLSAMAWHELGRAIALCSPVTSGTGLVVGDPDEPRLQPSSVNVPVHVMTELGVPSAFTAPRAALDLELDFLRAGVPALFSMIDGDPAAGYGPGDEGPIGGVIDGHLRLAGLDSHAVAKVARFLMAVQLWDATLHPENEPPLVGGTRITASPRTPVTIDLAQQAYDPEGEALTFSLPAATSSHGAALSLDGSRATYTPEDPGVTDGFVFTVTDAEGATRHAVITVSVGR